MPSSSPSLPASTEHQTLSSRSLEAAYQKARRVLLDRRTNEGVWEGELSSSALSTATAVCALHHLDAESHRTLIEWGTAWLLQTQRGDGGWGDTVKSSSNISTSMLCRAALTLVSRGSTDQREQSPIRSSLDRVEAYLEAKCGGRDEATLAEAIRRRYGKDRTFSVPILCCSALAGLVDWSEVEPLPFELACPPSSMYRFLRMPVVSYALPALIAIGLVRHRKKPPRNPIMRFMRNWATTRALKKLQAIQPTTGGFLEATPLTSFVTMSLAGCGLADHPVAVRGAEFLRQSVREDGSWPIDTHLATWVTTLSVNALAAGPDGLRGVDSDAILDWLLKQQWKERHPYTDADPGGWAWTPLSGGVPDSDDTPGALIAIWNLQPESERTPEVRRAVELGVGWLLDLQNSDGGWPTFCRGWGHLPFDRSGADLTAHALRALHHWKDELRQSAPALAERIDHATARGLVYLKGQQREDGSWVPLWFGNEAALEEENPVYGTSRVLAAFRELDAQGEDAALRGIQWLLRSQSTDGGWGGDDRSPPSVEETAQAVDALANHVHCRESEVKQGLASGIQWLADRVEDNTFTQTAPIGFYFARLWYFEELYPLVYTVTALGRGVCASREADRVA